MTAACNSAFYHHFILLTVLLFEFYLVNCVIICVNFCYALVVSGLIMLKAIVMLMLDPVLKLQSWFSELCFMSFVLCISIPLYDLLKLYVTCIIKNNPLSCISGSSTYFCRAIMTRPHLCTCLEVTCLAFSASYS